MEKLNRIEAALCAGVLAARGYQPADRGRLDAAVTELSAMDELNPLLRAAAARCAAADELEDVVADLRLLLAAVFVLKGETTEARREA